MKKLLLLSLVLVGMVTTVNADIVERTVYYAVQSSTVGSYTVKLNVFVGDNTWVQSNMSKTSFTYTSNNVTYDVYMDKFEERYGGVDIMQFQLYDKNTYHDQQQPIGSWTTYSTYTNRMYVHNIGWTDFSANYTRSDLGNGKFGTICLPYAATVSGATVYEITSKVMTGSNLTGLNLTSVTNLAAGTPYIFKASGASFTATLSGNYTDAVAAKGMVGNLSSALMDVTTGYVVSGNQVCPVGTGVTIGQYRAYITLEGIGEATSRGANFIGFEDATGIENIQAENAQSTVYNLQGQRVTDAQKGLVIVNGKKMLRK